MNNLETFRFWCQKVLPLVYDDSLSYYEVLCKVVDYINNLIAQDKIFSGDIAQLQSDLKTVQAWIDNFDTSYIQTIIDEYVGKMIYPEINDEGYFMVNVPSGWDEIEFNTTGYDIDVDSEPEYGHLVLSMWSDRLVKNNG